MFARASICLSFVLLLTSGGISYAGCSDLYGDIVDGKLVVRKEITSIGNNAFQSCTSLKYVDLTGSSVKSIGSYAFYRSGLTGIDLNEELTSIGYSSFRKCQSLKYVDRTGSSVESIGDQAF